MDFEIFMSCDHYCDIEYFIAKIDNFDSKFKMLLGKDCKKRRIK